eukprot:PhF_6_TR21979/c0_g1_i1/m.31259/K15014/SLC29A1_2_3, ENT1_2_3; solute carrier family 29 (equilibrative nucleoside transporter), member 1/2/3
MEMKSTENVISSREEIIGRIVFGMLGMGTLIPWACLITSLDYFMVSFPNTKHYDLWITAAYIFPTFVVISLQLMFGCYISFHLRFYVGFTSLGVCLLCVLLAPLGEFSWGWIVVLVALLGLGEGASEGALYPFASLYNAHYVHAAQIGQSVAGVSVSLGRILTRLIFVESTPDAIKTSTYLFFGVCSAGCFVCLVLFWGFQKYFSVPTHAKSRKSAERPIDFVLLFQVVKKMKWSILALLISFTATLLVFPGLSVVLPSKSIPPDWFGTWIVFTFNSGDVVGRLLGGWFPVVEGKFLLGLATLRTVVFIPAFVMLGLQVATGDGLTFFVMSLMSISHGYVCVCCFLSPGTVISKPAVGEPLEAYQTEIEQSGNINVFVLLLGLVGGIYLAIPFCHLVLG